MNSPIVFSVNRFWNGTPCTEENLHGTVVITRQDDGLEIQMSLPHQQAPNIPENVSIGSRVANLWEYDVVECFLAGEQGYFELELGAGGHFLALSFSAPRVRSNEHLDWQPKIDYRADAQGWTSTVLVPWHMVPSGLRSANAFVIVRDNFLAFHPTPGDVPNFHQPESFPP
ncbi:MAG: hypothetical protein AAB839_02355, partial [Patescibacteria group bacterium]